MKKIHISLILAIVVSNFSYSGEFSIGFTSDLLQQDRNEFSWNYERRFEDKAIATDTVYSMELDEIKPAFGVFAGYQGELYKSFNYNVEYGYTTMKYNYSFTNGIGSTNNSYMNWSRHTIDVGISYTFFDIGNSRSSIGIGESLTFVSPMLSSNETDIVNVKPMEAFNKNSLSLNDRRGEYLYITYQNRLLNTPFKYQLKLQLNYIEATFIDWFAPTIRLGIVF